MVRQLVGVNRASAMRACRSGRPGPSESPAPNAAADEMHAVADIMRPLDGLRVRQLCPCCGFVKCVEDTTSDNASSTQQKALVGYIDDTQSRAGDKCRSETLANANR
jgi:hypothetical protein